MKKTLTYLLTLAVIVVAALLGWHFLAGSSSTAKDHPGSADGATTVVAATKVTRGDLSRTIRLTAEFRPYQQVDIHAKVAGFIKSIPVDIGDRVKTGDVLATLEIPELEQDLKKAAAAVDAAREGVNQANANYQVAHGDFTRLQQVAKEHSKLIAQQEIDTAAGKDQAAAAGLASAKQHVEEALAEQSRQLALVDYSKITAPFDGVVTRRFADVGALIQAGTSSSAQGSAVISLSQENVLRAVFPVPESAVSAIQNGAPVQIEITGLNRIVEGKVTRFSRQLTNETRTMSTEVDVPNDDLSITAGMYGWAELTLEQHKDVLSVPVDVVSSGTSPSVYLIDKNDQLEERPVKLGLATADRVEIVSGLHPGDLVYIGNRSQVRPGMRVQPKITDTAANTTEKNNG